MILPALLTLLPGLLDKLLPDKGAADAAKLEFMRIAQSGELAEMETFKQLALAQAKINEADANGQSAMQRLWRPFMGWACVSALAYSWVAWPLLAWVSGMYGVAPPPVINTEQQFWIVGQMIGLAGMRTAEKIKGVA